MLSVFVIAGCVLMTCAGPPVSGYSLGTLNGGRGQEYSSGYRSGGGFVGMKDSQGDLSDHLGAGSYAASGSNRYSVINGAASAHQQQSPSSYSSDSGYADAGSTAYGGQSTGGNPEALSLSSSSYSADVGGAHGSSGGDLGAYSSAGSSAGLGGYSSAGNTGGSQIGSGYHGYSEGSSPAASSLGERGPSEYSSSSHPSSSHPSSSYVSYSVGGPKASAYTAPNGNHGHGISYSSSPSVSYMSTGHHGGSSHSPSSYSSESHPAMSSGPTYSSSSSSLGKFLASMHGGGPSNYIPGSSGHRGSSNHLFATSSNPSPNYSSRGPGSGYYSNSPYPRGGGGKIILLKESGSGRVSQIYPGEQQQQQQHSYGGGMFGGSSGAGYKIRSVGSSPSYGPSFAGGYSSGGGHSGGHHPSSNHGGSSFFGLL